jgi:hypothetical protein
MKKNILVLALFTLAAAGAVLALVRAQQEATAAESVVVYKTATCGCCGVWVEHLRAQGFAVVAHDVSHEELTAIAREAGVAPELRSCHTAKVGGYAIEGHVPAADIARLLRERPDVAGIAVPGMPVGSPGMEMGDRRDPYNVVAFAMDGRRSVFAQYR